MQLRDIHYVLAAADEGSFSKAAVKVHVSQPALSQLIQRLEDELGVKLFVRKSNRVTLTPAGKIFYEDGKVILALSDQLIHKMNEDVYKRQTLWKECISRERAAGNYPVRCVLGPRTAGGAASGERTVLRLR